MKIESSEFEHGRVYFKQFGAERVNTNRRFQTPMQQTNIVNIMAKGETVHHEQFLL